MELIGNSQSVCCSYLCNISVVIGERSTAGVPSEVARGSTSIRDSATARRHTRTRQLLCTYVVITLSLTSVNSH